MKRTIPSSSWARFICLILAGVVAGCSKSPELQEESTPSFDLAQVKGFAPRVVAITGKPVADEAEPVQEITNWSLNRRGQLSVWADKSPGNGPIEADLFLIDGKQAHCLMRQRGNAPYTERKVRSFIGCELNDQGSVLIHVAQETPAGWKLNLVDAQQIQPVPQGTLLAKDYFAIQSIVGSQGHVAFVLRDPGGRKKPDLCLSDGTRTEICASAQNDPFDPSRRFRGFNHLLALNARGQLLFEASTQQDEESRIQNERLCMYTPVVDSHGKLTKDGDSSKGEVRELARQGEVLPGTDWTMTRDSDCWSGAKLNDRGDVVFAQVESNRSEDGTRYIAILRNGNSKWQVVLRREQQVGQPPQKIQSISFPSINSRGQIACIVEVATGDSILTADQLLLVEPDGKITVLAKHGDQLAPGVTLDQLSAPQILPDGKVVFQAMLRPPSITERSETSLVMADGKQQRLVIRDSTLPVPGFQRPKIEDFRVSDMGHVAVLVEGDAFEDALLLVSPDFSSPQAKSE